MSVVTAHNPAVVPREPAVRAASPWAAVMPRKMDGGRLEVEDRFIPSGGAPGSGASRPETRRGAAEHAAISAVGAAAPGALAVPLRLVLLGPPLSGKSTQGAVLAEERGLTHISVGELLREAGREGKIPEDVREAMARGDLAPSELVFELLSERLQQPDCARGFVLDGYPREEEQLAPFTTFLQEHHMDNLRVIGIEVPESELLRRAEKRGREDDRPDVVRHRLEVFRTETGPVIRQFQDQGIYHAVDGTGSPDETAGRIAALVDSWQFAAASR
ncbi:MAG: nucleoside monophosphate kinase [Armatimonadetes bacterium]|nr:nucleoside monophosphate kinase [Armatimonadota bacterium]